MAANAGASDVVPGTLDMLILRVLAGEPMHGWGIGQRIEESSGVFTVKLGSLYPALDRLHADGLVSAEWRASENNRRARFYRITKAGERRLQVERRQWEQRVAGIARVLAPA